MPADMDEANKTHTQGSHPTYDAGRRRGHITSKERCVWEGEGGNDDEYRMPFMLRRRGKYLVILILSMGINILEGSRKERKIRWNDKSGR